MTRYAPSLLVSGISIATVFGIVTTSYSHLVKKLIRIHAPIFLVLGHKSFAPHMLLCILPVFDLGPGVSRRVVH